MSEGEKGENHGESWARSMLPYGGWRGRVKRGGRVAKETEGDGRERGRTGDTAKGEPARAAAMGGGEGEKIDILIGQNNWNERTNGRS